MEILRQAARLFGHKNKQYETLTEITHQGVKIRVWRSAKTLDDAKSFPHAAMQANSRTIVNNLSPEQWDAALMDMPCVACVAIVDANGNGVSSYPDWH